MERDFTELDMLNCPEKTEERKITSWRTVQRKGQFSEDSFTETGRRGDKLDTGEDKTSQRMISQ